ncbi:MAG: DUF3179 domain-containing protein [Bacteroidota bacterium]
MRRLLVPPPRALAFVLAAGLVLAACDSSSSDLTDGPPDDDACSIPANQFASGGVAKDGIPALTDPEMTTSNEQGSTYLDDDSRIIGLVVDGQAYALPHNILWWHEIANLNLPGLQVAVTYCPLTGSSLTFDRAVADGAEFGVSGLLFQNNLTMYDRRSSESLWPQMNRASGCGTADGTVLPMVASMEMTWQAWQTLHPATKVISSRTGVYAASRYQSYPYGDYEVEHNDELLFPMAIDRRRPPKERVLGIPLDGGRSYPFGLLDASEAPVQAVMDEVGGRPITVFWDRTARAAMAYYADARTFRVEGNQVIDTETGSTWRIDGLATAGPQAGTTLEPVAEAYVAFWFAWAAFHPETELWEG